MDTTSMLAEVRQNLARRDACPRHRFPARGATYVMGEKLTCEVCGSQMKLTEVGQYIRGFVAAGGTATDVMPDWTEAS